MRAAIYLRVSTDQQTTRYGLDAQKADCMAYLLQMGYQLVATFADSITGTSTTRPGLDALLGRTDEFDLVVIPDVDRLARAVPAAYAIRDQLLAAGLEVHGARDGRYDPDDESREIMFGFKAIMASNDRKRIVRRLIAGRAAKVARGEFAKPIDAYGWKLGKIDPLEAEMVRWIFSMALKEGGRTIIEKLFLAGVRSPEGSERWHTSSLNRLLKNPLYKGEYHFKIPGGTAHVLPCEAIVKPEIWQAVQLANRARRSKQSTSRGARPAFPLTGRAKCGNCGHAMVGMESSRIRKDGTKLRYYNCGHAKYTRRRNCTHITSYQIEDVHDAAWTLLRAIAEHPAQAHLYVSVRIPDTPAPDMTAALAELDRKWDLAYAAYEAGAMPLDRLQKKTAEIQMSREALQRTTLMPAAPDIYKWAEKLAALVATGTDLRTILIEQNINVIVMPSGAINLDLVGF